MWELRPTMGAAWELHLAAAFGRPGAADGSCAMGAVNFVGAAIQPLPAAAKRMGAALELRRAL